MDLHSLSFLNIARVFIVLAQDIGIFKDIADYFSTQARQLRSINATAICISFYVNIVVCVTNQVWHKKCYFGDSVKLNVKPIFCNLLKCLVSFTNIQKYRYVNVRHIC